MKNHQAGIRVVILALALSLGLVFAGCGEKIALPEASGFFSIDQYTFLDSLDVGGQAVQLTEGWGFLFVLTQDALSKYDTGLNLDQQVTGLAGATALCADKDEGLLFVWENDAQRVTWFNNTTLEIQGSFVLPDVSTVVAMATNKAGVVLASADLYLYLSDPESGVIHRYAFDRAVGLLSPFGILTSSDGAGARFVHEPAGLTTDGQGFLLVCDTDLDRNWVTRFAGTPDTTDAALRGLAALFDESTCGITPAATDYVIGNAAECEESDWVGGPSGEDGEFHLPSDVAVDLSGRIFVADTRNSRIQMFDPKGNYITFFSTIKLLSDPTSLSVIYGTTNEAEVVFGAYVIMTLKDRDKAYWYISKEYDDIINEDNGPD